MHKLNRKIAFRAALLLLTCALTFSAQAQVRVVGRSDGKSSLEWSGFRPGPGPSGTLFLRTLQNDLVRSGWFTNTGGEQAEFQVVGTTTESGGRLVAQLRVHHVFKHQDVFGQAYKASAADARQLAHKAADEILLALRGKPGIASTRFALLGTKSGNKEIYYCDADGANLRQVTQDKSISMNPSWGPNGEKLVYTSFLKGFPDVYLVNTKTMQRDRISKQSGLNSGAAISPDGKEMALILSKDGKPELYIQDLRSGRVTQVTNTRMTPKASPSWSPDGTELVYVSGQSGRPHLYTISRNGRTARRITTRGSENVSPDWGPNGLIAYSSQVGQQYQVNILNPQTMEIRTISPGGADYEDPSWAPDGRHIACTRTIGYKSSVYILDILGDPPIALVEGGGDWYAPAWSPK